MKDEGMRSQQLNKEGTEVHCQNDEKLDMEESKSKASQQKPCDNKSQDQFSPSSKPQVEQMLTEQLYKDLYKFRIQVQDLQKVEKLFKKYIGTHKFHNYTRKLSYNDPSSNRYILDMEVSKPVQLGGLEFIVITLKGQSFLYNQIRKMMGAVVQVMRWNLREEFIDNTFQGNSIGIPVAPGEGLMLNRISYEGYNKIKGIKNNSTIQVSEDVQKQLSEFKTNLIKIIADVERQSQCYKSWLAWLDCFMAQQQSF